MRRAVPVVVALLLGLPAAARSQGTVTFDRPTGELGSDFDGSWLGYGLVDGDGRQVFRQWLDLGLGLSLVDPGIFKADVDLRPVIGQIRGNGGLDTLDGSIERLDGAAAIRLLSAAPVSFRLWGRRVSDVGRGIFGTRNEYDMSGWGAEATSRYWLAPVRFEFREWSRDLVSTLGSGQIFRIDEVTRTGRASLESSRTRVVLERVSRDDRIDGQDFTQDRADLGHRLSWGKGSSLDSRYRYYQRSGIREATSRTWSERARIRHLTDLTSVLYWGWTEATTGPFTTEGRTGEYTLQWRPGRVLQLGGGGQWREQRFGAGSSTYARARPRVALNVPVNPVLSVFASAAGGYEWHDQTRSDSAWVAVVGEEHRLDASLGFRLAEYFVDASSLVLRSPDGTILYQEGFDYRVVADGPVVEVFALPGGRLGEDDTVVVDYRYLALPGGSANAWVGSFDVRLQVRGPATLTLFHNRSMQDAVGSVVPGSITTLINYDYMETGATVDVGGRRVSLSFGGQVGRRLSDLARTRSAGLRGGLRVALPFDVTAAATGSITRREGQGIRFTNRHGSGRLVWTPSSTLRLAGTVAVQDWDQDEAGSETFVGGGFNAEYRLGLFLLEARVDRNLWEGVPWQADYTRRRDENRVIVRLTRTF